MLANVNNMFAKTAIIVINVDWFVFTNQFFLCNSTYIFFGGVLYKTRIHQLMKGLEQEKFNLLMTKEKKEELWELTRH